MRPWQILSTHLLLYVANAYIINDAAPKNNDANTHVVTKSQIIHQYAVYRNPV